MISVLNHLQQLSGSRLWLALLAIFIAGCSPKIRETVPASPPQQRPITTQPVYKATPKAEPAAKTASAIAMILPLNLQNAAYGKGYSAAALRKANMSVEYYQGFKLALDSLTADGYNYKLQLFDDKDIPAVAKSFSTNPALKNADLIVGPVFPESIKAFTASRPARKPILSPLSPVTPAVIRNPLLVTANPPLQYHARRAAQYAVTRLRARKILILKSGFSEDNKYLVPFKQAVDSIGRLRVKVVPLTVVRGNLKPIENLLSKTEQNVVLIPAVNRAFLQVTLRSLDSLGKIYPVTLIGHPSWEGFSFLQTGLLQRLHTVITSSEHVNYRRGSTIAFVKAYRRAYKLEPTAYAFKGFDQGMYFGELLSQAIGDIRPEQRVYEGLINDFRFIKRPAIGWINTNVRLLRYADYELKNVE